MLPLIVACVPTVTYLVTWLLACLVGLLVGWFVSFCGGVSACRAFARFYI